MCEQHTFLALVRAGLWEDVGSTEQGNLGFSEHIDWNKVYQLAGEQSVVGLVAAGIEHVTDTKPSQEILLQFVGEALQLELRNREMNDFIALTVEKMRKANIYGLLVKGSELAQCYERPLWRNCGDIDFFFSKDEYCKAVDFFLNHGGSVQVQNAQYTKSFGVVIKPWFIEIHGTLRNGLSSQMDLVIDEVQRDTFCGGNVRSWTNGKTQVLLPDIDNDLFLVFVHYIRHFYKGGICIRQVCDWCRLLWTYKDSLNRGLLESRIRRAGLMSEWKAFSSLAVDYLGMPVEAMPLYDIREKWHNKSKKVMKFILDGRHGKMKDTLIIATIFPWDTMKFLPAIFFHLNWMKVKERLFV